MIIETKRLLLRTMTDQDTEQLLIVFSDPRVMASFGGRLFDLSMMKRWVDRNLEHQDRYGYGLFSVILKDENILVGNCGLEHMEVGGVPEVELGYDIRSDYWNRGIATEAASAVRDYSFGTLGMKRLISLIRSSNAASCRVAEKVGMSMEREIDRGGHEYRIYFVSSDEA